MVAVISVMWVVGEMAAKSLVLEEYSEQLDIGLDFKGERSPGDVDLRVMKGFRTRSAHSWRMCLLRREKVFISDNLRSKSYILGSSLCVAYSKGDINAAIRETLHLEVSTRKPSQACCFRHQI